MLNRLFFPPTISRRYAPQSLIADILIILGTLGFLGLVARVGAGALTGAFVGQYYAMSHDSWLDDSRHLHLGKHNWLVNSFDCT